MRECVIYARVSTERQSDEGYSIDAQLEATRGFCERLGLMCVREFVAAESARKPGRAVFGEMLSFFAANPSVRCIVAHGLDRITRNFVDKALLDELGVELLCVQMTLPDGPEGELVADTTIVHSKYFLAKLSQEVRKGMRQKAEQGGWTTKAPVGYLNDRLTRTIVPDPKKAPLVVHAFKRYSTGLVSLSALAHELKGLGLRNGNYVPRSAVHKMLRNPAYIGFVPYCGQVYPGQHEAIVERSLFDAVQAQFESNRGANQGVRHVFALRGFAYCGECGCRVTAERQRGHTYYHCTFGKGRERCSQRKYVREELLMEQVEELLGRIEIPPDIAEALAEACRMRDTEERSSRKDGLAAIKRALAENKLRQSKLLDLLLDGTLDRTRYEAKAAELEAEQRGFEHQEAQLDSGRSNATAQVEAIAATASTARVRLGEASVDVKREVLAEVLSNITLQDGRIASYQWKSPYGVLEMDSEGALLGEWWA